MDEETRAFFKAWAQKEIAKERAIKEMTPWQRWHAGVITMSDALILTYAHGYNKTKYAQVLVRRWLLMRGRGCSYKQLTKFVYRIRKKHQPGTGAGYDWAWKFLIAHPSGLRIDDAERLRFTDTEIKKRIVGTSKIPFECIPDSMVEAAREHFTINRMLKERGHAKHGRSEKRAEQRRETAEGRQHEAERRVRDQ